MRIKDVVVNKFKSIVNDYVAAEQQYCNKLNFIHDKYTRVLQYSSTLSKSSNRVTNQEIVKKLGKCSQKTRLISFSKTVLLILYVAMQHTDLRDEASKS